MDIPVAKLEGPTANGESPYQMDTLCKMGPLLKGAYMQQQNLMITTFPTYIDKYRLLIIINPIPHGGNSPGQPQLLISYYCSRLYFGLDIPTI